MAKVKIGEIRKLVCVGNGDVAAIGEKGVFRFCWKDAHSRGRCEEIDDVRLNMALRRGYGFPGLENLALTMPRGAVIPLPSAKRANNWLKQNRGPKSSSKWFYESALEAGFRPRYYLGEDENPYENGKEYDLWGFERLYFQSWALRTVAYEQLASGFLADVRRLLEKIPDWQTRVVVAHCIEEPFAADDLDYYRGYIDTEPLL